MSRDGERLTGEQPCPCGSGEAYQGCCGPLHDNRIQASTAEQLMRSRYSAYAVGRLDHVLRTWHPRTRPTSIEPMSGLAWTGLSIHRTEAGQPDDEEGVVEFVASYRSADGRPGTRHERSRFARRAGRWFYLDAE